MPRHFIHPTVFLTPTICQGHRRCSLRNFLQPSCSKTFSSEHGCRTPSEWDLNFPWRRTCLPYSHRPHDGGSTNLWNVGPFLRDHAVQHPRRHPPPQRPGPVRLQRTWQTPPTPTFTVPSSGTPPPPSLTTIKHLTGADLISSVRSLLDWERKMLRAKQNANCNSSSLLQDRTRYPRIHSEGPDCVSESWHRVLATLRSPIFLCNLCAYFEERADFTLKTVKPRYSATRRLPPLLALKRGEARKWQFLSFEISQKHSPSDRCKPQKRRTVAYSRCRWIIAWVDVMR
jgi:hypothetical protein